MKRTKGQRDLAKKLGEPGWSQMRLAEELRVNQSAVSLWVRGFNRPGAQHRKMIEMLFGIPVDHWLTGPEAATMRRAERRLRSGTEG